MSYLYLIVVGLLVVQLLDGSHQADACVGCCGLFIHNVICSSLLGHFNGGAETYPHVGES
jgi:hypothetical protein